MKLEFDEISEKQIEQLQGRGYIPWAASTLPFPSIAKRLIGMAFDLQKAHDLPTGRVLSEMAIALADALDSLEIKLNDLVSRQTPAPIIMCADCPRKDSVLSNLSKENVCPKT